VARIGFVVGPVAKSVEASSETAVNRGAAVDRAFGYARTVRMDPHQRWFAVVIGSADRRPMLLPGNRSLQMDWLQNTAETAVSLQLPHTREMIGATTNGGFPSVDPQAVRPVVADLPCDAKVADYRSS
jgi:hypothetical protein